MDRNQGAQSWSTTAPTYSGNVARTSAIAAARLLELANGERPFDKSSVVLDDGAGTGAVTLQIASSFSDARIVAVDVSSRMLDIISAHGHANVSTKVVDARTISKHLGQRVFTHAFNTFMLQTITTPLNAVKEMYQVLQPNGIAGIGLWAKRNGPFEVWERACQTIDPNYELPTPFDDPNAWRTTMDLEKALYDAGFENVRCEEIAMPFPFKGAEAFSEFWFEARNPAAVKCMSNWERKF